MARDLIQGYRGDKNNAQPLAAGETFYDYVNEQTLYIGDPNEGDVAIATKLTKKSVKRFGAKGDGVTDDKAALQLAFNGSGHVHFPNGTYMINIDSGYKGLQLFSNTLVTFEKEAVIKLMAHNEDDYAILDIRDIENVTLVRPRVDGSRDDNAAVTGEQGHGINIRGAKNVKVYDPECIDCWGDGIYIGSTVTQSWSEDVYIGNAACDNNRRQGISLVSGKNVKIENPKLTNTNGTAPQSGIDIEPNDTGDFLDNILIDSPVTEGNAGGGVKILTSTLGGAGKRVDITVRNHVDRGSVNPLKITSKDTAAIDGKITIEKPVYMDSDRAAITIIKEIDHPRVVIDTPTIIDPCVNGAGSTTFDNGISMYFEVGDVPLSALGGIDIINPVVYDSRGVAKMMRAFYVADFTASVGAEDINVIDPIRVDDNTLSSNLFSFNVKDGLVTPNEKIVKSLNGSITLSGDNYAPVWSNKDFSSSRVYTLSPSFEIGTEMTFIIENESYVLTIQPDATEQIVPDGTGLGKYIATQVLGSRVTIKKVNATDWFIKNEVGTWAREA